MEKFRKYLEQISPLPESDWTLFSSKLRQRVFRKKDKILNAGSIENHLSFVEKGIVRYYLEENEKEITFEIAFENSFATAYDSFLTRKPAPYHAEALTDTLCWSITYEDLQAIYNTTLTGNRIGRLAAEEQYIKKTKRQLSLLKDTAEQRYLGLFTDYPHLVQLIPQKYLASYIGITPQALSRIRKRIS